MLQNASIRQKLYIGFGALILLLIGSGIMGITELRSLFNSANMLVDEDLPLLSTVKEIKYLTTKGHLWFEEILSGDEGESVQKVFGYWKQSADYCDKMIKGGTIEGLIIHPVADAQMIQDLQQLKITLNDLLKVGEKRYNSNKEGINVVGSDSDVLFDAAYEKVMSQSQVVEKSILKEVALNHEGMEVSYNFGNLSIIALSLLGIVFTIVFVVQLSNHIITPVKDLATAAEQLAKGENGVRVRIENNDEIGLLGTSFNNMADNLNKLMSDLKTEKSSVEQKVQQAVSEAESQREYLSHNVNTLLAGMERFAKGDLSVHLNTDDQNEIGRLFDGFNRSVEKIEEMILEVQQAVEKTAETSAQISDSSEELSIGIKSQAMQSADAAAAVEEMTRTIVHTAQNTTFAAGQATESGKTAREGGEIVRQTVEKINQIAETVINSTATVEKLGDASAQIGEIIMVIDDIADQTNLLALNAAIEAARAGDQGRGFAVVADEVRRLAERTTEATKKIAQMIRNIQIETENAVNAMKKGSSEVTAGIELADKAGNALGKIVSSADKVVEMVQQIAAANEQQSTTSEDISVKIETISKVSSESETGVAQISEAVVGMRQMTLDLKVLMKQFQLRKSAAFTFADN
ncbi:MAG: methyl-accepting chemotaxis protein [Calditrichia bacterium]|nr:methyl-accepting chemotaxis protein [Calditrichota bacterium]MCB0268008.1 methyl-accepting chemotaxis protein [Calditrichota bacterium]MCB0285237.1 methyl-accepting chemotaxis protein [Calditrichota bacterium]MCB9066313.1 methyl-accepting chemotaxis protein [Calditrichia bacterium]